jgi:hypothetical protein
VTLRRTKMGLSQYIITPPTLDVTGPVCALCDKVVDSEELVEGIPGEESGERGMVTKNAGSDTCRVLVRHHGQEEIREIDFGSREWGPSQLASFMQRIRWFNPLEQGDAGKLSA